MCNLVSVPSWWYVLQFFIVIVEKQQCKVQALSSCASHRVAGSNFSFVVGMLRVFYKIARSLCFVVGWVRHRFYSL